MQYALQQVAWVIVTAIGWALAVGVGAALLWAARGVIASLAAAWLYLTTLHYIMGAVFPASDPSLLSSVAVVGLLVPFPFVVVGAGVAAFEIGE